MATTHQPPDITVFVFTQFYTCSIDWPYPPDFPIEDFKRGIAIAHPALPLDLDSDRLILRKRGERKPSRDGSTMRSNGIVDGSELDFEVVGLVLKMKGGILKY